MRYPLTKMVPKIALVLLLVYAVALTGAIFFAVTVGPFQEPFHLWSEVRVLETKLKESEQYRRNLEAERDRLLTTVKNLQADWAGAQEAIRALRELTQNPDSEQRLVELNRLVEKLSQERAILILKLNELRQAIQSGAGDEPKQQ